MASGGGGCCGAVVGFFGGAHHEGVGDDYERGGVNIFVNVFEIYDAITSTTEFVHTGLEPALR